MKFLILGSSGMAGHMIALYLKEQGHTVSGFDRHAVPFVDGAVGNAMDTTNLQKIVCGNQFDVVINCIGILNQFAEQNKAQSVFLNSYLPHYLAEITSDTKTQVFQMSTDCVFSGKIGNYVETSFRDGESFYDRTKALGELEDNKNLTLRNSIVGPDINPMGIGLLNWFMKQNGKIQGYTGAMWTGLTTLQLAKIMEKAALQRAHGLYNMVPIHNISKYGLLKLFNYYLRNNSMKIEPYHEFVVNKTLIRTCFDFPEIVPDYEIMVKEMAVWMQTHASLYPHYDL